jgi:hypothetical protein
MWNESRRPIMLVRSRLRRRINELTIILSSVSHSIRALEPGHPARTHVLELQNAAERCAHDVGVAQLRSKELDASISPCLLNNCFSPTKR